MSKFFNILNILLFEFDLKFKICYLKFLFFYFTTYKNAKTT